MKTKCLIALFCTAAALAPAIGQPASVASGADRITVNFVHPENFTDLGPRQLFSPRERESVLRDLGMAMKRAAAESLPGDQRLEVTVRDIDRAGDFESWRSPQAQDVRVLRDLYPPRLTIEYRLRDARGELIREGRARPSDQNYLQSTRAGSDPLRYDKALFRAWVQTEFAAARK
jgi:hypothetical protein